MIVITDRHFRPGPESYEDRLDTLDLCDLLPETCLQDGLSVSPRLTKPQYLREKTQLADLEHFVLQKKSDTI